MRLFEANDPLLAADVRAEIANINQQALGVVPDRKPSAAYFPTTQHYHALRSPLFASTRVWGALQPKQKMDFAFHNSLDAIPAQALGRMDGWAVTDDTKVRGASYLILLNTVTLEYFIYPRKNKFK